MSNHEYKRSDVVDVLRDVAFKVEIYDVDRVNPEWLKRAADEIERLRSLTQWQPIETAPKDGTRFWGRVDDDAIAMQWHSKFKAFVSSWRLMTMAPGYKFQSAGSDEWVTEQEHSPTTHKPTHWMPLPPPPEDKT